MSAATSGGAAQMDEEQFMSGRGTAGQSLIESCLVIAMLSLILLGVLQVSRLFAAKEVLGYAATKAARARTVGFNRFMVFKTVRVGTIPVAGPMRTPAVPGGPTLQHALERPRIPLFLGAASPSELPAILDYEDWQSIVASTPGMALDGSVRGVVRQQYPLTYALHRAYYDADTVALSGEAYVESHFPLYLDDEGY